MKVAAYVLENGIDREIKAPLSRSLGYDVDAVKTKALRQKSDASRDKHEHAFYVVYNEDAKSKKTIKEIILANTLVTEGAGKKHVDGFDVRIDQGGGLLAVVHAIGFYGQIQQNRLDIASKKSLRLFKDERDYQLRFIDFR